MQLPLQLRRHLRVLARCCQEVASYCKQHVIPPTNGNKRNGCPRALGNKQASLMSKEVVFTGTSTELPWLPWSPKSSSFSRTQVTVHTLRTLAFQSSRVQVACKGADALNIALPISRTAMPPRDDDDDEWGVLLYYKFVALANPAIFAHYLQRLCESLSLRGRVRVAPDGVNVTVTGTLPHLRAHTAALHAHPRFAFPLIDFKLSPAPAFAEVPPHLALACGFAQLSVRLVPHLITLAPSPPPISNAGPLVSPLEFHSLLQDDDDDDSSNCVLIDARNVYETRIGKFQPPRHVQFFDPRLRQYSDLPGWIDAHQEQLRNKRVLMYCTGGVRCELASSYLRSKGKEFEDVVQLSGGIHRYMEAFADGGYFKGKNFVFDHRMAVASSNEDVVGRCLLCKAPFDDYAARHRCSLCRLLVLICNRCQGAGDSNYVCELCEVNVMASEQPQQIQAVCERTNCVATTKGAADLKTPLLHEGLVVKQKLRLLCLHGFRQNASGFKGRLGSLQKKLKRVAEFVFVDAPHQLPFVQLSTTRPRTSGQRPTWKYAWLVSPSGAAAEISTGVPQEENAQVEAERPRPHFIDAWQYETQTEGWEASWEYLQKVFHDSGPFDGVLGFSQGAAVAAALCQLRGTNNNNYSGSVSFTFAVLCSGYPLASLKAGDIPCPSLHIYGEQDRQIHEHTSEHLASLFCSEERSVVKHASGHIIPTQPGFVDQYLHFFSKFL